jgi:hypothetical protein
LGPLGTQLRLNWLWAKNFWRNEPRCCLI